MAQALLLLCISSLLAGGVLSQFGPFGPGSQGGNSAADDFQNILDWLDKFSGMSPAQQNLVLMGAGMALQAKTGMDCNIFGGPFSCKPVPITSSYVQQCGAQAEQKIDCALYPEVTTNLFDSPVDDLQDYLATTLGPQVKDLCPQCFERVQSLWCALAAPPCGTFGTLVQGGILPVLSQAVKVYRSKAGTSRADAVATIMGAALTMAGAGLPCRSMCKAMETTCSCGGPANDTLGTLLSWLSSQQQLKASRKLPSGASLRVIFKDVWDVPLCSLFPEDGSQSAGARCTPLSPVPLTCTSQQQWCDVTYKQNTDTFKYAQSIMLLQLLRATTGWFTNDNEIIWGIHHSVKDAVDQGASTASSTENGDSGYEAAPQSTGLGAGQVIGITFLSLFAATLAAVGGVAAWKWWKARNAESQYFQLTEKDNFVSLSAGMH